MSYNYGDTVKTKISKGNIKAFSIVDISNPLNYTTKFKVKDKEGNEEEYKSDEVINFGWLMYSNSLFDITKDGYESGKRGEEFLEGNVHLTPNVRGATEHYRFWQDCKYGHISSHVFWFDYQPKELNDDEVVQVLLDEILYGVQPDLQSISCVGTNEKGIDKNPNYRDGHYLLNNGIEYTMTWCRGKIKIRQGIDNGWYSGGDTGRLIFEGEMDWEKYKLAKIKAAAYRITNSGRLFTKDYPEVLDIVVEKIKNDEKFKLSHEF